MYRCLGVYMAAHNWSASHVIDWSVLISTVCLRSCYSFVSVVRKHSFHFLHAQAAARVAAAALRQQQAAAIPDQHQQETAARQHNAMLTFNIGRQPFDIHSESLFNCKQLMLDAYSCWWLLYSCIA